MDKNPIRGETYVRIALLALMLVSIGFLVVRGIVIVQAQQSLAAAEGASAASAPSKKDTLTPQCAAATKNNEKLAQYGVREDIRTQMPVEYNKSIKEAATDGFCKSEYKVKESWGEECNSKKCPMGVTVFPPGTKLSPGVVQCSTDSKGFVVACRNNPDAEQPSKQDTGTQLGKSTEQLAKDAAKTDAGQGGGQGGGSGGGSGSGQTPSNEALDKVFGEDKPNAAQATEKAEQSKELAKEIAAVQEEYNKAVNQGASQQKINELAGEIELLKNERAQLAPYERDELLASKQALDAHPSADWATQRSDLDKQISSLDTLIKDYGAQGAGQQTATPGDKLRSDGLTGIPYQDPNAPANEVYNVAKGTCFGSPACGDQKSWNDSVTGTRDGAYAENGLKIKDKYDPDTEYVVAPGSNYDLEWGKVVQVCNQDNGSCIVATVRSTCLKPKCFDVTTAGAQALGYAGGVARLSVSVMGDIRSQLEARLTR